MLVVHRVEDVVGLVVARLAIPEQWAHTLNLNACTVPSSRAIAEPLVVVRRSSAMGPSSIMWLRIAIPSPKFVLLIGLLS
jgi:hypothetical protein